MCFYFSNVNQQIDSWLFRKYIQESLFCTLTFRKLCSFVNYTSIHLCINELLYDTILLKALANHSLWKHMVRKLYYNFRY